VDTAGQLLGITTGAEIRGFRVVVPAAIAWKAAADVLEHGTRKRGYLGIAGQPVSLGERQRGAGEPERALLIVGIVPDSPAETAGLLVGDIVLTFDGEEISSPERLLDVLAGDRVGRSVPVRVRRGGGVTDVQVTVGERVPGKNRS
jgi:S1-C subfamily serine protease